MWLPWSETTYTSCCKEAAADAKGTEECQEENQMEDGWWNVLWLCLPDSSGGGGLAKEMRWYSDILSISAVFSQHLTLLNMRPNPPTPSNWSKSSWYFMRCQLFGMSWYTCKITTMMQCFRFEHLCREALPNVAAKPPADVEAEPEESAVSETNFCVLHTKWTRWWPTQACSSDSSSMWCRHPPFHDNFFMPLSSRPFYSLGFVHISQDESYDLHDRKAFAKFLIDADIRLVPWMSHSTGLLKSWVVFVWWCVAWLKQTTNIGYDCSMEETNQARSKPSKSGFNSPLLESVFFSIFLEVAHKLQSSSRFFGMAWHSHSCCSKLEPLKLRDMGLWYTGGHHYIFLHGTRIVWDRDWSIVIDVKRQRNINNQRYNVIQVILT